MAERVCLSACTTPWLLRISASTGSCSLTGAKRYMTYETNLPVLMTPQLSQFLDMFRRAGSPFWLYGWRRVHRGKLPGLALRRGLVPLQVSILGWVPAPRVPQVVSGPHRY